MTFSRREDRRAGHVTRRRTGALLGAAATLPAQSRTRDLDFGRPTADWCSDARDADACEVREETLASVNAIDIDGRANGGISIRGWDRNDVHVRVRIIAHARTDAEAQALVKETRLVTTGGRTVWLAGQTATKDTSGKSIVHDFEAQARTCFELMGKTLERVGGSLKDLVTMTVFISDARHGDRFRGRRFDAISGSATGLQRCACPDGGAVPPPGRCRTGGTSRSRGRGDQRMNTRTRARVTIAAKRGPERTGAGA